MSVSEAFFGIRQYNNFYRMDFTCMLGNAPAFFVQYFPLNEEPYEYWTLVKHSYYIDCRVCCFFFLSDSVFYSYSAENLAGNIKKWIITFNLAVESIHHLQYLLCWNLSSGFRVIGRVYLTLWYILSYSFQYTVDKILPFSNMKKKYTQISLCPSGWQKSLSWLRPVIYC